LKPPPIRGCGTGGGKRALIVAATEIKPMRAASGSTPDHRSNADRHDRRSKRHLDQAEDDLAQAHQRVAQQRLVVEKMRQDGHDTKTAQHLLRTLEDSARAMEQHRNVLLEELGLYRPGEIGTGNS
jgi:hypothetical protein